MTKQPTFSERQAAKALFDARCMIEGARRRFDGRTAVGKAIRELEAKAREVEQFCWQTIFASQLEKGQTG